IERIHEYVEPFDEDMATPDVNLEHEASSTLVFDPAVIEPDPSWMQVKWYVNYVDQTSVPVSTIEAGGATDVGTTPTDFTWTFDCTNEDLTVGLNKIRAYVFDHTGYDESLETNPQTPYENDTRMVRRQTHKNDHANYYVEWTVNYNGEGADLFIRDYDSDDGTEPTAGYPIDHSPDIVVRNNQMSTPYPEWGSSTFLTEDPDIDNSPAYIYVRVQNKGCEASDAGTLAIYTSIAGGGLSWDANWTEPTPTLGSLGYQVGADPVSAIDGGSEVILEMEWDMVDLTGQSNWESCLLARLEDFDDAISPQTYLSDWIWENNNIAMHNVTVVNMVNPPITEIGGKPYAGGWTYTGNTTSIIDTFNYKFDVDDDKISKNILDEAEIIVYFEETGFDVSGAIDDNNLVGMTRVDSTLFRITSDHARIDSMIVPADTLIPTFIGYAFLTEEVDT
ncbi:MAG: hypothetical protein QF371_08755, partial [Flavobacteriales bacterium]|nr:hypothetical protein [Flavobacteriales bacterium]